MDYLEHFKQAIQTLQHEQRYRRFVHLQRHAPEFPQVWLHQNGDNRAITVWCSNDYLGLGCHPEVTATMAQAAIEYGAGAGGTRNISGNHHSLIQLEQQLAKLHQKNAALVCSSGWVANLAALSVLPRLLPDCLVLSDEKNHNSLIEGIRRSGAEKAIFRHNDIDHLAQLLQTAGKTRNKIIVLESLYSMDGSIAPLQAVCELAQIHRALIYLDEVHAVGLYGNTGAGIAEQQGQAQYIDIIQGTLAKGFGTFGGYLAANNVIIDAIRSYAPAFIFTTALPPAIVAAAHCAIELAQNNPHWRKQHQAQVVKTRCALTQQGLPLLPSPSHILPLMVGDAQLCQAASERLLDVHNIYIQAINYPTVAKGSERLRITPTPYHNDQHIAHLSHALTEVWHTLKLPLQAT